MLMKPTRMARPLAQKAMFSAAHSMDGHLAFAMASMGCVPLSVNSACKRRFPSEALDLMARAERCGQDCVECDGSGQPFRLTIPRNWGDNASLAAAAEIPSLSDLKVYVNQRDFAITRDGIASLRRLTNLSALRIWCGRELPPGVLAETAQLRTLRLLELVASDAPSGEYSLNRIPLVPLSRLSAALEPSNPRPSYAATSGRAKSARGDP